MAWYNKHKEITMPIKIDTETRFWSKVIKRGENECWIFTGGINSTGRGMFYLNGKSVKAHRVSYILTKGKIPDKAFICHTCDNGKCVNPNHLFIGDALTNNRDCYAKGRHPILRGEDDPKSKLNNEKVLKIIEIYKAGEYSQYKIASLFSVSRSTVLNILRGRTWSDITGINSPLNIFANNMSEHKHNLAKKNPPNYAWGETASHNKLKTNQVLAIRKYGKINCKKQDELANQYGVTRSAIKSIIDGKSWKNI